MTFDTRSIEKMIVSLLIKFYFYTTHKYRNFLNKLEVY